MKVGFYEVCISYIIYCLLFYILTPFFFSIFITSITPGERGSGSIGHKDSSCKRTSIHINGGGKCCLSMDSMRHSKYIAAIYLKVGYESMIVISFWNTAKGYLPHVSYIFCKPEPLGAYFNTVVCSFTGSLILIEIQRGNEVIDNIKEHMYIGATSACKNIMMEATKGIGQRDMKVATRYCFLFGSWFSSKKSEEYAMDVGADIIGMVKTDKK